MSDGPSHAEAYAAKERFNFSDAAVEILDSARSAEEVWGKLLAMGYPPSDIATVLASLHPSSDAGEPLSVRSAVDQQVLLLAHTSATEGMVLETEIPFLVGGRLQAELVASRTMILGTSPAVAASVRDELVRLGVSDTQAQDFDPEADIEREFASMREALTELAGERPGLVVCCTQSGNRELARFLNREAVERRLTVLYHHTQGFQAQIGPLVVPGDTACYECFMLRREATLAPWERALLKTADKTGELAVPLGVDWLAVDVLKYLTRLGEPISRGRVLFCDYLAGIPEVHTLLRLPRCPVCRPPETPPVKLWNDAA